MKTRVTQLQSELISVISGCGDESLLEAMLVEFRAKTVAVTKQEYISKVRAGSKSLDEGRFKTHEQIVEKFAARKG